MKHARGAYIALLNNDTAVEPKWLEELYDEMVSDERIGACASCMIDYYNRDKLDTASFESILQLFQLLVLLNADTGTGAEEEADYIRLPQ